MEPHRKKRIVCIRLYPDLLLEVDELAVHRRTSRTALIELAINGLLDAHGLDLHGTRRRRLRRQREGA